MKRPSSIHVSDNTLSQGLPKWVTKQNITSFADLAFMSGAALSHLHTAINHQYVPKILLRERLSLIAAEKCVALTGRIERTNDLRDAVHLLRKGEDPGPAGHVLQNWRQITAADISTTQIQTSFPTIKPDQLQTWLGRMDRNPIDHSAMVFEQVIKTTPRPEEAAFIIADAVLARALGWTHVLPFFALNLTSRDRQKTGEDLRRAFHNCAVVSTASILRTANDLTRRVAQLRAVAPKLRAKQASQAIEIFLTQDVLTPSIALTGILSDRSARRLCTRLVELGVVRELSGRDTFRLYGV